MCAQLCGLVREREEVGDENTISQMKVTGTSGEKEGYCCREEEGGAKGLNVSSAGGWGES